MYSTSWDSGVIWEWFLASDINNWDKKAWRSRGRIPVAEADSQPTPVTMEEIWGGRACEGQMWREAHEGRLWNGQGPTPRGARSPEVGPREAAGELGKWEDADKCHEQLWPEA